VVRETKTGRVTVRLGTTTETRTVTKEALFAGSAAKKARRERDGPNVEAWCEEPLVKVYCGTVRGFGEALGLTPNELKALHQQLEESNRAPDVVHNGATYRVYTLPWGPLEPFNDLCKTHPIKSSHEGGDMVKDKNQALLDLLLGWTQFVGSRSRGPNRDTYPESYATLAHCLYTEANATLEKEGDAATFIRDRLLPLFGGEAPTNAVYGWTEKDVLSYWNQLREWEEVVDQDLSVEVALEILAEAFEDWQVRWEAGNEDLMAVVDRYVEANGLKREKGYEKP